MKKLHFGRLLCLSMTFLSVASLLSSHTANQETQLPVAVKEEAASSSYYESCRGLSGSALLSALTTLTTNKHTTSVSYSGLRNYYLTTDVSPSNSSKVLAYYTGSAFSFSGSFGSSGGGINREHVWPQSYLGNYTTSYAGSDLFNVHPCEVRLNSTRGNLYFDEVNSGSVAYEYTSSSSKTATSARYSSVAFDPNNSYCGDVARSLFYVATRYASMGYTLGETPNASNKIMGKLSTLLAWNKTYGVTTAETTRNDATEKVQGNRNPFIDHPEFATMIWDSSYSGSGALNDTTGTSSGSSSSSGSSTEVEQEKEETTTTTSTSYKLTASGLGLSTSYASGSHTVNSIKYYTSNILKNSSYGMQFKKSSGYIYNSTAYGSSITKIVVTLSKSFSGSFYVYGASSAGGTTKSFSGTKSNLTYTFTFSGSYKYFKLGTPSKAMYVSSIVVTL